MLVFAGSIAVGLKLEKNSRVTGTCNSVCSAHDSQEARRQREAENLKDILPMTYFFKLALIT
jgi:hypothetical protein